MRNIANRERKKLLLIVHQGGLCGCGCGHYLLEPIDLHHMLSDTDGNNALYPLYMHSLLNLKAVRHDCHMSKPVPQRSERYAQIAERQLQRKAWMRKIVGV